MKERPILFSAPMVRAILDGQKTKTRRVVKPRGRNSLFAVEDDGSPTWSDSYILDPGNDGWRMRDSPYGQAGDRLWVKETFKPHSTFAHLKPSEIPDSKIFYAADNSYAPSNTKWWPSLFMQRRFSRILLEIVSIRVERLNECSEADALAEGSQHPSLVPIVGAGWSSRDMYARLWEHINGTGSWAANPWVWVVEFKRVEAETAGDAK